MATNVTVDEDDVEFAETFLTTYLSDKIPEADFSEGSVVRDFAIKAIAYTFAFLSQEIEGIKNRQSLRALARLPEDDDVDEAVDDLLSNIFLERLDGSTARLPSTVLHFSRATDIQLPATTRFYRTTDLIFSPENDTFISASDLRPTVSADGTVVDYTITLTLKAAEAGTEYNVTAGRFLSADPFNPYFLYAENVTDGIDGTSRETTQELLERAPTGIAVRNLVNERSIKTVLRQRFSNVKQVQVIGFGDTEMLRDRVPGGLGHLNLSVGGHTDIYIGSPRTDVTETLAIGGFFVRPDGVVNILRDTSFDFVAAGVEVGHVLNVTSGLLPTSTQYLIANVTPTAIEVQTRYPFLTATDEASEYITYSIGYLGPGFDNVVASRTQGQTSRKIQIPSSVILSGRPHYKIKKVEVINGSTITDLTVRTNNTPGIGEYQVIELNMPETQSVRALTQLIVHASHTGNVRVTYETLVDYASVQTFALDRFERVICSNPLIKGLHPVYIELDFRYRLSASAQNDVVSADVSKVVTDYINTNTTDETIDLSNLRAYIRNQFPAIGIIYEPFNVRYKLIAPDGQVYYYTTKDVISIRPNWPENNARLINGLQLRTPIVNADLDPTISSENAELAEIANGLLQRQLANIGISDRTIRYMAAIDDILATKES